MGKNSELEVETESVTGFDRRSMLKKGAVAGTIAWSAPTLLSSRALAGTGSPCTPKCGPSPSSGSLDVAVYCTEGSGAKWAQVWLNTVATTCPCDSANATVTSALSSWQGSPTPVVFLQGIDTSGGVNDGKQFFILKGPGEGALGQGTYTGTYTVTSSCTDRDGDVLTQTCIFGLSFLFQPDSGSCEGASSITAGIFVAEGCGPIACTPAT